MTNKETIGFVGSGQMARALGRGFSRAGLIACEQLTVFDVSAEAVRQFLDELPGSRAAKSSSQLCRDCTLVILAVKPQHMTSVLAEIQSATGAQTLVVSIAAGIGLAQIEAALPSARVMRVMPSTPCLVGAGAAGFAAGAKATDADAQLIEKLLSAVGVAIPTPESQLDAVTGLSGSGPAYVFMAIDALSDGGVKAGLPRETAARLAAQTVLGAAKMVLETGEHPAVLKDRVASPGGTTIAGIHALENAGFRGAIVDAVVAASDRSRELSDQ